MGRVINRHYYTEDEIAQQLQRSVVQRLIDLITLRNTHAAFQGVFKLLSFTEQIIAMEWRNGADFAHLEVNFKEVMGQLRCSLAGQVQTLDFVQARA